MSEGTEIKSPYIELNPSNSAFKILSFHNIHKYTGEYNENYLVWFRKIISEI